MLSIRLCPTYTPDIYGQTTDRHPLEWCALALLLIIGPRSGRFPEDGLPRKIPGANVPVATLGVILLWMGWFGFNGSSTLAMNGQVPGIIANTVFAGAVGMVAACRAEPGFPSARTGTALRYGCDQRDTRTAAVNLSAEKVEPWRDPVPI